MPRTPWMAPTTIAVSLALLNAWHLSAVAEEKPSPADFYVPKSGHLELTVASADVAGLDRVKTLEDVLAFRARVAAQVFDREDLVSWRLLERLALTKIEDEAPELAPGSVRRGAVDWRDAVVSFDETRHSERLSCDDLEMLWIDTPSAHTWVSYGTGGSRTTVRHFQPKQDLNRRRLDADRVLLRSEKRLQAEWSVVSKDDLGTLYLKTIVHEANETRPKAVVIEQYLLADPSTDDIRMRAAFRNSYLFRFELATQPLKMEKSEDCVVPGFIVSFDHSNEDWYLSASCLRSVALDSAPRPDAFVYRVQAGDQYQGYNGDVKPEVIQISNRGPDIAELQPAEGIVMLREAERRFWENVRPGE